VPSGPRTVGDTIEDPFPVAGLPFTDLRSSCDFTHQYDEMCPYGGYYAPDVVYAYVPAVPETVEVELCNSGYDTKLYMYRNDVGDLVACNDDLCGPDFYRSAVYGVELLPGNTYYIVVDSYGLDCGEYELVVTAPTHGVLDCPPEALLEGEPDCQDGYVDEYNGGCAVLPEPAFTKLPGTPDGERFEVCGTSGTFETGAHRDTDWYLLRTSEESTLAFECEADFGVRISLYDAGDGCDELMLLDTDTAGTYPDHANIASTCPPGDYLYRVAPVGYHGVPCGSRYVFSVEGYTASPVAVGESVQSETWSRVKALHR
jgi:hypothetical protein